MHHYPFHVGDYVAATAHLTNEEDLAYRRLLDLYYSSEEPLANDCQKLARRIRCAPDIVQSILEEFFDLSTDDGLWHKSRCDEEIAKFQGFKTAGKRGAEMRWGKASDSPPIATPIAPPIATKNQEPEPRTNSKKGSRLSPDWMLPKEWETWAKTERPDLNIHKTAESFRDFWISKAGAGGVKLDWQATWRNWVRSQKGSTVAATPIAIHQDAEKTKQYIDQQFANSTAPSPEIRARIEAISKSAKEALNAQKKA
jgi:uncharacterized protein YdaU (DUF1376 family)